MLTVTVILFLILVGIADRTLLLKYQIDKIINHKSINYADMPNNASLGIGIQEFSSEYLGKRIIIVDVIPNSTAMKIGLKKGDIITAINGEIIKDKKQAKILINQAQSGKEISLSIFRGGQNKAFSVKITSKTQKQAE